MAKSYGKATSYDPIIHAAVSHDDALDRALSSNVPTKIRRIHLKTTQIVTQYEEMTISDDGKQSIGQMIDTKIREMTKQLAENPEAPVLDTLELVGLSDLIRELAK
jgi:ABC-type antimicrobial peptide transport system ATPase subunit